MAADDSSLGLIFVASALSAAALSAYVPTVCPGTPGGDAGEMLQLAIELGIPHPPGYPTWTMLAHVFYLLPMPSTTPAWRVNLSSAVFDALAAGMLCAAVGFWSRDTWAGLAAGGAFAFAPLVWQYAVQSEVFALNNLLCAALFLALVRYDASRTLGRACAGAAVAGLALTNQHTAVFFVAPFAVWTLLASASSSRPGASVLLRPHRLLLLGACGLLGLSPYLFLVVQGGQGAAWGSWGNQRSVSGFLTHLLRREYGTFRLANAPATGHAEFLFRLRLYFGRLPIELPPTGAPLALLGFCWSLTLPGLRRVGLPVACAFGLYVLAFHWLANLPVSTGLYLAIQQRFWPQANLIVCAWFGIGAATAARRLVPRAPGVAAAALAGVLVFWHAGGSGAPKENGAGAGTVSSKENAAGGWWGGAGGRVSGAWPADCVESDLFDQFGAEMLRVIPEGEAALLLTYGDEVLNSLRYPHRVLRQRPDLRILDLNYAQYTWFVRRAAAPASGLGGVVFPGQAYGTSPGSFVMAQLLGANDGRFSIFVAGGMHPQDGSWQRDYRLWPWGAISRVLRRDAPFSPRQWARTSAALLPRLAFPSAPPPGSWAQVVLTNHYLPAYALRPYALLRHAYDALDADERRDGFRLAAGLYLETDRMRPLNGSEALPDYFYRNMGVAFSQLSRLELTESGRVKATRQAASSFMKYLAFDTLSLDDRRTVEQALLSLLLPQEEQPSSAEAAGAGGHRSAGSREEQPGGQQGESRLSVAGGRPAKKAHAGEKGRKRAARRREDEFIGGDDRQHAP